jgi:malonyl-CoA O-methyltransferase
MGLNPMLDPWVRESRLDKSSVRASFNRAAAGYDDFAVLQRGIGERLLQFLSLDPESTPVILDLGAGTGYCSRRIARQNARVIDLDLAPAMLGEARSREDRETDYVCGDAESLPFTDQCMDIVFSNLMIQWCGDLQELFREVHRILKPGGSFLFSTFGPETLCELRDAWKRVDFETHVHAFSSLAAIRTALSRSGLQVLAIEQEFMRFEYQDVMELMRTLKGIGAHNLTETRPRALTGKRKVGRMIAEYGNSNPDQKISATFELLLGRCKRSGGPNVDR